MPELRNLFWDSSTPFEDGYILNMVDIEALRAQLLQLQEDAGLKQAELGAAIGWGQSAAAKVKNGTRKFKDFELVDRWVTACGHELRVVIVPAGAAREIVLPPELNESDVQWLLDIARALPDADDRTRSTVKAVMAAQIVSKTGDAEAG